MADIAAQMAQGPRCILAVYPDDRASWLSPLQAGVPGAPWPSLEPRNFVAETEKWYDLGIVSAVGMDDWEFAGEFQTSEITHGANIIYRSTDIRVGLYMFNTNIVRFYNSSASGLQTADLMYEYMPALNTWVKWRMQRVDGWLRWFINDVEVKSTNASGKYLSMDSVLPPTSTADCHLRNCCFKNLTTGKTLWSYPSFAERTRLLTLTNIRTDRGVFEGASTGSGVLRRVKSQLDLRGNTTSKTLVCKCYIPSHADDGKLYVSGLVTQGHHTSGAASYVFFFSVWEDYRIATRGKTLYLRFAGSSNAVRGVGGNVADINIFDRWVTLAGVIDYASGKVAVYMDGVKVAQASVVMEPFGQGAGNVLSDAVSILHDANNYVSDHRIAWAHVYDYAMSEEEIRLLAPSADPV